MYPILSTVGPFPVMTITVFLLLAFLVSLYVIWKASVIYDIDGEKVIDLFLWTVLFGYIGARIWFMVFNLENVGQLSLVFSIFKYPGYYFWGSLLGGSLALGLLCHRFKFNFWQAADFAVVGLFIGVSIVSLGCLFNSCQFGYPSDSFFAVGQVGVIDKRFPLQVVESLLFFLGFIYLWRSISRFHATGAVAAKGLILMGLLKLFLEIFRGDKQLIPMLGISQGFVFSMLLVILGFKLYYKINKRSFVTDLKLFLSVVIEDRKRQRFLSKFSKEWYNFIISAQIILKEKPKSILKAINVKSNPKKF